jgi:hypothetical protein
MTGQVEAVAAQQTVVGPGEAVAVVEMPGVPEGPEEPEEPEDAGKLGFHLR